MSAGGYAAAGMTLFNMYTEKRKIQAQNDAAAASYNATNSALTMAQQHTWENAAQAADEMRRVSAANIRDIKPELQQKLSAIGMSEGITAGSTKGRILRTAFLQSNEGLGKEVQKTESVVNKIAMSAEQQNWAYQNQKVTAYQNMKASIVSGNNARLQIIGTGINGAVAGYSMGSQMGGASSAGASASSGGSTT